MNKKTLLKYLCLFCFAWTILSCGNNEDPDPNPMMEEEEDAFPTSFTKKILFEKISREPCTACPGATKYMLDYTDTIENVLAVSIQVNDNLSIPYNVDFQNYLAEPGSFLGYPEFSINRIYPESSKVAFTNYPDWDKIVNEAKNEAILGLAIDSKVSGDILDLEISIGSFETEDDFKLTIYLYEEDHPESSPGAQSGGNGTAESPYLHHNLLVEVVTEEVSVLGKVGDQINLIADEIVTKKYEGIDISALDKSKLYVLAIVHKDNDPFNIEIANFQFVKAGMNKDFD